MNSAAKTVFFFLQYTVFNSFFPKTNHDTCYYIYVFHFQEQEVSILILTALWGARIDLEIVISPCFVMNVHSCVCT